MSIHKTPRYDFLLVGYAWHRAVFTMLWRPVPRLGRPVPGMVVYHATTNAHKFFDLYLLVAVSPGCIP
jgi:hypothetical protein